MRENRPIPLTSVYSYWTKLDMLSTPHTSNSRGRPKLKIETSTRREPSAFEIVASAQDSYSPRVIAKASVTTKKVKRRKKRYMMAIVGSELLLV
ncbi:hypothetical protein ACSBR1_040877 [Camellia fascicularis]